jgi:hypothetical protein
MTPRQSLGSAQQLRAAWARLNQRFEAFVAAAAGAYGELRLQDLLRKTGS